MTDTTIEWQSPETTPAGDPFLTVKKARGYYYYAERGGVDSIAFVLLDKTANKIGLILESKPPMDEMASIEVDYITAFGGSIDSPDSKTDIVITEVLEEAGYVVTADNVTEVGSTVVSTQMSQTLYAYTVDVTGIPKTAETEYESQGKGDRTQWMTFTEALANSDWKSIFIMTMLGHKLDGAK